MDVQSEISEDELGWFNTLTIFNKKSQFDSLTGGKTLVLASFTLQVNSVF